MNEISSRKRRISISTPVLKAVVALPLAIIASCTPGVPESTQPAAQNSMWDYRAVRARDVYSPNIATDRYVIEEQRRVAQALRLSCEQFKTHCAEADQAARFIAEADARR